MINNEMCQGCLSINGLLCIQTPIRDDIVCPCVSCIVKTMCRDACEEFAIYTDIPKRIFGDSEEMFLVSFPYNKGDI